MRLFSTEKYTIDSHSCHLYFSCFWTALLILIDEFLFALEGREYFYEHPWEKFLEPPLLFHALPVVKMPIYLVSEML